MASFDFDAAADRAADDLSSHGLLLSSLSREMLLDILETYGYSYRWHSAEYTTDDIDAALATLRLELMTDAEGSGSMQTLLDIVLEDDTAAIELTDIPATFAHLLVYLVLRSDKTGEYIDNVLVTMNGIVTGSKYNYGYTSIRSSNGVVEYQQSEAKDTASIVKGATAADAAAGDYSQIVAHIPGYSAPGTNKRLSYKDQAAKANLSRNTFNGYIELMGTTYVIDSLLFAPVNGENFKAGSRVSIYGVRGA